MDFRRGYGRRARRVGLAVLGLVFAAGCAVTALPTKQSLPTEVPTALPSSVPPTTVATRAAPASPVAVASPSSTAAGVPIVRSVQARPQTATAGTLVTLTYVIDYAGSTPLDVRLGASLYPAGERTPPTDDSDNDDFATLDKTERVYRRAFLIRDDVTPGVYDLVGSVLSKARANQWEAWIRVDRALQVEPATLEPTPIALPPRAPATPALEPTQVRLAPGPATPTIRAIQPTAVGGLIPWTSVVGPSSCSRPEPANIRLTGVTPAGDGTLDGTFRNPCDNRVSVQIDVMLLDARTQAPVAAAETVFLEAIDPGAVQAYTTHAPKLASEQRYVLQPHVVFWLERPGESMISWNIGRRQGADQARRSSRAPRLRSHEVDHARRAQRTAGGHD